MPRGPWSMVQIWYDLLFAHWQVPSRAIQPLVPDQLPLDTFNGQSWVSVTPFHMSVRARGLPPLPFVSRFPELNCRTYVNVDAKPGVFFFSLDAGSHAAVWGARRFYHLPYFYSQMRVVKQGESIVYSSRRGQARWSSRYGPIGPFERARPGTIEHWLTERYCLYSASGGRIFRAEIHHAPWPLEKAAVELRENTIAEAAGIRLPGIPTLLAFARELRVLIWPLRRIA